MGLRSVLVGVWRFTTGPASVLALALVAITVATVAYGPPVLALWWIARAVAAARGQAPSATGWGLLGSKLIALGLGWYLARRCLPPFRWRY